MKILNIMLSPHLGGIEHSSVSWSCILTSMGHQVTHLIRANADIKTRLKKNIFHSKSADLRINGTHYFIGNIIDCYNK